MSKNRGNWGRSEEGFTLVELAMAALVMAIVMTSLATVLVNSLVDAAYNRQRVEAVNLANQAVEEVRALASSSAGWQKLWQQGQLASDPDSIATPSTDPNYNPNNSGCFEGQPLDIGGSLVAGCATQMPLSWQSRTPTCTNPPAPPDATGLTPTGSAPEQPLQPHEACYTLDRSTYVVDSYLTGTNTGSTTVTLSSPPTLTLTTVVTWTQPDRNGNKGSTNHVATTTQLSGCSVQLQCT